MAGMKFYSQQLFQSQANHCDAEQDVFLFWGFDTDYSTWQGYSQGMVRNPQQGIN